MAETRTVQRSIDERWVIEGTLTLVTPGHFGNGDSVDLTDMSLLLDESSGAPLLPGTSIAGALRNYLREFQNGDGVAFPDNDDKQKVEKERGLLATKLFGSFRNDDDEGNQSPLIVHDAPGLFHGFELRDGVKIDAATRTAEDKKKYDIQLLAAGTTFKLRFELLAKTNNSEQLRKALVTALEGLSNGHITLGARKRRGFGECQAGEWQVWKYNLRDKNELLAWLVSERDREKDRKATIWKDAPQTSWNQTGSIANLLDAKPEENDRRNRAHLSAAFAVDGTLIIRSGFGASDEGPDTIHLHSKRAGKQARAPIIPGTSWAGALRHRALKIARTLSEDKNNIANSFIDGMFGPSEIKQGDKNTYSSRITIKESEIKDAASLVMTRIKIDRFTGGAFEGALFSEQPIIGKKDTCVTLDLTLRNPQDDEVGIMLLLLKDLWTGDLPVGGESGIGRGRLRGITATLHYKGQPLTFKATNSNGGISIETSEAESAQVYVNAFNKRMGSL